MSRRRSLLESTLHGRRAAPLSWQSPELPSNKRETRGGARAGALLALRIKAEDSRESPVEQLRRANKLGRRDRREIEENGDAHIWQQGAEVFPLEWPGPAFDQDVPPAHGAQR